MDLTTTVKWTKVHDKNHSISPRPRHGHRAVAYRQFMIVYGGGNEGIVDNLDIFDTTTLTWFQPVVRGDIPPGFASFGLVVDDGRLLMHGGMAEYGRYTTDLYELKISNWEWRKLKPKGPHIPCPRIGHSFTIIKDQVFLFGGLANDSENFVLNTPRHLDDLYILQAKLNNGDGIWDIPITFGTQPSPRESHSAAALISKDEGGSKLYIYGGMRGYRLGDLYILDVDTLSWYKPQVYGNIPSPRSLHTATMIGKKMYIYGGWVPMFVTEIEQSKKEWKCTSSLACFDTETFKWTMILDSDPTDVNAPKGRAGHSAVLLNTRLYIWAGRDGYKKAWTNQVCCKDMWKLEVDRPACPDKVKLIKADFKSLLVGWDPVPDADSYILQCSAHRVTPVDSGAGCTAPKSSVGTGIGNTTCTSQIRLLVAPAPTTTTGSSETPPGISSPIKDTPVPLLPPETLQEKETNKSPDDGDMQTEAELPQVPSTPTPMGPESPSEDGAEAESNLPQSQSSDSSQSESIPDGTPPRATASPSSSAADANETLISPALLPAASSLLTASSLVAAKSQPSPGSTPIKTSAPSSTDSRGILRLPVRSLTPSQVVPTRTLRSSGLPASTSELASPAPRNITTGMCERGTASPQANGKNPVITSAAQLPKVAHQQQQSTQQSVTTATNYSLVTTSAGTLLVTCPPPKMIGSGISASSIQGIPQQESLNQRMQMATISTLSTNPPRSPANLPQPVFGLQGQGQHKQPNARPTNYVPSTPAATPRHVFLPASKLQEMGATGFGPGGIIRTAQGIYKIVMPSTKIGSSIGGGHLVKIIPISGLQLATPPQPRAFAPAPLRTVQSVNQVISGQRMSFVPPRPGQSVQRREMVIDGQKVIVQVIGEVVEKSTPAQPTPTASRQQKSSGDNGQGGLKGGSVGPRSAFSFSQSPWMKLKGGGFGRDSPIPIYSVTTKFSWKHASSMGLKGGAGGEEGTPESGTGPATENEKTIENSQSGGTPLPRPVVMSTMPPQEAAPPEVVEEDNWVDVAHTRKTSFLVNSYFKCSEELERLNPDVAVDKDLSFIKKKENLKPCTVYKFRVAAVNSCGRGPWSKISAYQTCLPGLPGAPRSVKISFYSDGAVLMWDPPLTLAGGIIEYSVLLATKTKSQNGSAVMKIPGLNFERVYSGALNQCKVTTADLSRAFLDSTDRSKPAILFRIAAKSAVGYGAATQVRWLQDSTRATKLNQAQPPTTKPATK